MNEKYAFSETGVCDDGVEGNAKDCVVLQGGDGVR